MELIRNRLSDLMGQRMLKISQVSKDTGIARSTLTPMYYNQSEMIKNDTINTLCKYLKISVDEFFESSFVDIEFNFDEIEENQNIFIERDNEKVVNFQLDTICNIKLEDLKDKDSLTLTIKMDDNSFIDDNLSTKKNDKYEHVRNSHLYFDYYLDSDEDELIYHKYISQLSAGMYVTAMSRLANEHSKFLMKTLRNKDNINDLNRNVVPLDVIIDKISSTLTERINTRFGY
ncbi:helix-turn-helix transcriptional regulator [Staphylococcus saprophyticus]|nr:helix-turn-helix transcriptional regulator [Staphylococcus saprophyticus]